MLPVPSGVHVWLAPGHTDMRKGFPGLSLLVQETLAKDPHAGHLFVFRGRRGDLVKIIWHDGQGACLFSKRLERGKFIWPVTKGGIVQTERRKLSSKNRQEPDRQGHRLSSEAMGRVHALP